MTHSRSSVNRRFRSSGSMHLAGIVWRAAFGVLALLLLIAPLLLPGCRDDREVVTLYTSVDDPFAREVVAAFEQQTGIRVRLSTDTEAGKTTGLVRRIEAERDRPQADVFWSSELFYTIMLAREGLLAEYRPPAEGIPDRYRDPDGRWTAFGVRGRVIGYNSEKVDAGDVPTRWRDLTDARWKGQLGVADPRFGTTLGHFAAMYVLWGEAEYLAFLRELAETIDELMDGNMTAARRVAHGRLLICSTDTDDVWVMQDNDLPIDLVYPDMGDGGTLLIPNSVGLITNGPNPETAKKLIDFLTSEQTERMLAESLSRNIPVRPSLREELGLEMPPETKIDFTAISEAIEPAIGLAGGYLIR